MISSCPCLPFEIPCYPHNDLVSAITEPACWGHPYFPRMPSSFHTSGAYSPGLLLSLSVSSVAPPAYTMALPLRLQSRLSVRCAHVCSMDTHAALLTWSWYSAGHTQKQRPAEPQFPWESLCVPSSTVPRVETLLGSQGADAEVMRCDRCLGTGP